jgi:hypothetical protein
MIHELEMKFDEIKMTTHVDKVSGRRTVHVVLSYKGLPTWSLPHMQLYDGETLTLGNLKGIVPIKSEFSKEEILNPKLRGYSMGAIFPEDK